MAFSRRRFLGHAGWALAPLILNRRSLGAEADAPIQMALGRAGEGLDFVLRNGATGRKYQVETMPGGLAVIDFDADGWPDLFCANGAALPTLTKTGPEYWNRLYRNNRNGTFTDVTASSGLRGEGYAIGAAVADYNNDGNDDLFVAGVHGNTLYRNNGNGTFTDVTREAGLSRPGESPLWSVAAAWIDYDNDGHLDLFISNYCEWTAGTDRVCAGLGPGTRTYCHPDLYAPEPLQLFHNNRNGTFTEVKPGRGLPRILGKGMGIAVADFARDGRLGLFVANDNAPNRLLRPTEGGFREIGLDAGVAYNTDGGSISGMGADFGDIDGDGRPDILVTGLRHEGWEVFLNQGGGSFADGAARTGLLVLSLNKSGWGCGLADLDNNGWLDFFAAGGGLDTDDLQTNFIFHNVGGRFVDVSAGAGMDLAPPRLHRGVIFADFDRDGRIDAAVSALNAPLELWWNHSPMQHWLRLRLQGRKSNRSAIGARVDCTAGGRTQSRWVRSSMGYGSSSDLAVHFGLGPAATANIDIHWPSGTLQKLGSVGADREMRVEEPSS
jgi:enediyne biosynthesis protein E4